MKVIGAGFGRTGTMSLKVALETLDLDPCYHMATVAPVALALSIGAALVLLRRRAGW